MSVARGEIVGVVGPSGVGKSILLRALMGLSRPTSGSARLVPDPAAETGAALAGEEARLSPWRRIHANVVAALDKTALSSAQREERALEALRRVGLAHHAQSFPHQLSSGQRQRVELARALALRPSFCCSTSRFSVSTRRRGNRCKPNCCGCATRRASPSCSSRAMSTRRSGSRIGWWPSAATRPRRRRSCASPRRGPRRRGDPGQRDLADTLRTRMNAEAEPVDNWVI
jgi:hypothetical protein